MLALGFIETYGLVGAIEAADAMLKAADVRLLEKAHADAGLVTIIVGGEVAAVRASVDAGVAAVQRVQGGTVVSEHVIARPDLELSSIIVTEVPLGEPPAAAVDADADDAEQLSGHVAEDTLAHDDVETAHGGTDAPYGHAQLKKMSSHRLREIAGLLPRLSLSREELAEAGKKELIDAIINAYRQQEEE